MWRRRQKVGEAVARDGNSGVEHGLLHGPGGTARSYRWTESGAATLHFAEREKRLEAGRDGAALQVTAHDRRVASEDGDDTFGHDIAGGELVEAGAGAHSAPLSGRSGLGLGGLFTVGTGGYVILRVLRGRRRAPRVGVAEPASQGEIEVGTRQVQDTEQISADVRREQARVEREGDVDIGSSPLLASLMAWARTATLGTGDPPGPESAAPWHPTCNASAPRSTRRSRSGPRQRDAHLGAGGR